ncbi:MAG: DUF6755 family protein [Bryobacteraceae bacterium]|jgi:nitrate/nitrite transporter NarK
MANRRHVLLGAISFTVCFPAWGLIGAFAPRFRETLHLTSAQTALLIAVPVIVQIWLLSATLESYLAGHRAAAVPGAIVSAILFAACLGLYLFVERIDSEVRKG